MAAVTELLVITLRQADSGKEQAGQKEVQSVVGGEKKIPGNLMWEPRFVLEEIRKILIQRE